MADLKALCEWPGAGSIRGRVTTQCPLEHSAQPSALDGSQVAAKRAQKSTQLEAKKDVPCTARSKIKKSFTLHYIIPLITEENICQGTHLKTYILRG